MALLDTPQAMYGSMSSPYLMQNPYSRVQGYYRDYEQETIARLNIHQRLQVSPEYSSRSVKEEFGTAFKPYSPGQENLPTQTNNHSKVFTTLLKIPSTYFSRRFKRAWRTLQGGFVHCLLKEL